MASTAIRERRRTLRCRNLLVRQMVQMKNKIGIAADGSGRELQQAAIAQGRLLPRTAGDEPDIDEGPYSLLRLCRETVVRLQRTESALVRSLECDSLLRVLMAARRLVKKVCCTDSVPKTK